MSDSWKGPSAVIGIMSLLVTIVIFAYQAYEARIDKAQNDLIEDGKKADEQRIRDSITKATRIAEQKAMSKIEIEKRILWIERHLPNYDDSIALAARSLERSKTSVNYARERLDDTVNPLSATAKQGINEIIGYYLQDLRDSFRIRGIIHALKAERQMLSDSLKLYYK